MEKGSSGVICPSCGHENRAGSKFCGGCGQSLAAPCPSCGAENPPGQRFCNECGAALGEIAPTAAGDVVAAPARPMDITPPTAAPERPPALPEHLSRKIRAQAAGLEGERKQVTVLFADVMGSMELAERIDPERWRAIMDDFFQVLADSVHRFEGTVDKFTGDGIMALFGAPIAHENHAQRASYAALEMQKRVGEYAAELRRSDGISLTTRIGINSGEVVVGSIGEDLSVSYTAVGHTVGLAQRMESLAEPGKAYLTEHAAKLVEGYVELQDLGEFEVKGSSRPLRLYELAGVGAVRGRLDIARQRGFSRFVGRTAEMAELQAALDRVIAGEGSAVGIVADAGIGKSRLCHEFAELCRARGIQVYEAQCQAHGRAIPLLPVLQMLRSYFGIGDEDSDRVAREKIAGRLLLLEEQFSEDLPLVFDLLAVPDPQRPAPQMNPEARQRRLIDILRRVVQTRDRQDASVNVIEDLHWIDSASETFLASFIDSLPGTPTLALVNFRPEYRADWMARSYYRQLPLAPLGAEAIEELLTELLGSDPSLDGLTELITERTGGNPFFIEEVVRELAESGALEGEPGAYRLGRAIDEIAVPATVQSILAARIDRLGETAKSILGAAAVIGKDFERSLLARVVELGDDELDAALRELVDAEFVHETSLYPEPEYSFRHPLTREVAQGSLLAERRAALHKRAAEAIQELEPDRIDELAALVAQHYEEAGEALPACLLLLRASQWTRQNDPGAALGHLTRIRGLDPELPRGPEGDGVRALTRVFLINAGWRLGMTEDEVREIFAEGQEAAERNGDRMTQVFLLASLGVVLGLKGNTVEAIELGRESIRLADELGDPTARVLALSSVPYFLYLAAELEEALGLAERVVELTQDDPSIGAGLALNSPYAWAYSFRTLPLTAMGRFAEAREMVRKGEEVCRRHDRESLGWAHAYYVGLDYWTGSRDGASALAHGRQAVEIAQRLGDSFSRTVAHTWLGAANLVAGDERAAIAPLETALNEIATSGTGLDFESVARYLYAQALIGAGDLEAGIEQAESAVQIAGERGLRLAAPNARTILASGLLRRGSPGDLDRSAALLDEAEALVAETGARSDMPRIWSERARVAALRGDDDARRAALEQGVSVARELGAEGWVERIEEALAEPAARP